LKKSELKEFLDFKTAQYNTPAFIAEDPVSIPHLFQKKEDIEISGFMAATIAWGNRKSILKNANQMMKLMDHAPYDFILNHSDLDLERFEGFVHRTFNANDLKYFLKALRNIYLEHGGLEDIFIKYQTETDLQNAIHELKKIFFELAHQVRTEKHVSDPLKNSAAKRINMYLRWMIRKDKHGVDFGIWETIPAAKLSCPLDVHSGNIARKLGILHRKANDAKAVKELDLELRKMDPLDPVKYDFALFGLGVYEKDRF